MRLSSSRTRRKPTRTTSSRSAGLCESQLALGRAEEADATVARLEQLAPESAVTLFMRARTQFIKGEYDPARTDLERILARDGDNTGPTVARRGELR